MKTKLIQIGLFFAVLLPVLAQAQFERVTNNGAITNVAMTIIEHTAAGGSVAIPVSLADWGRIMHPTLAQPQFEYITNNHVITIVKYTGPGGNVTVPDKVNGLPVTDIAKSAFAYTYAWGNNVFTTADKLTNVVIPDSVTNIEDSAFAPCENLTNVKLGRGIRLIGKNAFRGCSSLASIVIPDGVTRIEESTFGNCYSLTNVVIPNSVTDIGTNAFYSCIKLSVLKIPGSITNICPGTFGDCGSLTNFIIPKSVISDTNNIFKYADPDMTIHE